MFKVLKVDQVDCDGCWLTDGERERKGAGQRPPMSIITVRKF
jgi:hypothetical protein